MKAIWKTAYRHKKRTVTLRIKLNSGVSSKKPPQTSKIVVLYKKKPQTKQKTWQGNSKNTAIF